MKFGIFDHVDANGAGNANLLTDRLRLTEVYDRVGIYCYHVAEHHSTPLGLAPSPGILLSAVTQRTRQLRMGPLVYLLPFYHPLRLVEEICMLDQLSGGRFQLGIGRGISPVEAGFYGLDVSKMQGSYDEALKVVMQGLTQDEVNFEGEFYKFSKVPMTLKPVQRPHPPLWYGIIGPDTTVWAAANAVNVVSLALAPRARQITDRYRAEWSALGKPANEIPLMGISRHIVVAEDDASAQKAAARAYPLWRDGFNYLWKKHAPNAMRSPIAALYPATFEELQAIGNGCAGSPATVKRFVAEQIDTAGVNYMASWLAFGDLTLTEATRSAELFGKEVMPAFA
ncbi:MAG: LLM class flavin-dependent oxidoreductase [Betaproteobacteria bacterium]|nr:LLM class flavin-dependent oxidoreductase [Betaproteobacteria bacterium]